MTAALSPRHRKLRTRLVAAATVFAAVGAALSLPTAADAAKTSAFFTPSVSSPDTTTSPVAIGNGSTVRLDFLVANTSTTGGQIGVVTVTAPTGFTLSGATTNRTGWVASVSGSTVNALDTRPSSSGFQRPESIVVSVSATNASTTAAVVDQTWTVTAAGPRGKPIPFTLNGTQPVVATLPLGVVAFASKQGVALNGIAAPSSNGNACTTSLTNPVCSRANLGHGALSNVYFGQRTCTISATCPLGTESELLANLGTLYTNASPASVVLACSAAKCPYPKSPLPTGAYDANYLCTSSCSGPGGQYSKRAVNLDFAAYPVLVQLKNATSFSQAPRCVPVNDLTSTGQLVTAEAKAAGFCVDVNAITRSGNAFTGDVIRPVLYVDDVKMR